MKTKRIGAMTMMAVLCAVTTLGKVTKEFPKHWGNPPDIQTMDYVELPAGYGHGSSSLKHWILANIEKDKSRTEAKPGAPAPLTTVYTNDFDTVEAGSVRENVAVLGGEFTVKREGTNQFLELPGAPLDSFAAQFGPALTENVRVRAKIFGTGKTRRAPAFGVGVGGVQGWMLQVSPGKKVVELLKGQENQEMKASAPVDWKSGEWMQVMLQVRKIKDGAWKVEGKVWQGDAEPKEWTIVADETSEPVSGKCSVFGSPFSGTPIRFDDLRVERLTQ